VAYAVLSGVLDRVDKYPDAWKLEADPDTLTLRVHVPADNREMNILAGRLERGTSVVPKVPHAAYVRRFFAEEVSRIVAGLGLNDDITVLK